MQKLALAAITGLVISFDVGQAAGAMSNFINKVVCGGLTIG